MGQADKRETVKYTALQELLAQGKKLDKVEKLPAKDKRELLKSINLLRKLVKKTDAYIEFVKKSVTSQADLKSIPGIFMSFIDISANLLSENPSPQSSPAMTKAIVIENNAGIDLEKEMMME